jgi:hypothetical protein
MALFLAIPDTEGPLVFSTPRNFHMAYLQNFEGTQLGIYGLENELLFPRYAAISQILLPCGQEPITDKVKFGHPGAYGDALVINQHKLSSSLAN